MQPRKTRLELRHLERRAYSYNSAVLSAVKRMKLEFEEQFLQEARGQKVVIVWGDLASINQLESQYDVTRLS